MKQKEGNEPASRSLCPAVAGESISLRELLNQIRVAGAILA